LKRNFAFPRWVTSGLLLPSLVCVSCGHAGDAVYPVPFANEVDLAAGTRDLFVYVDRYPEASAVEAVVTVRDKNNRWVRTGKPDRRGEIAFGDIPFGHYTVDVEHAGSAGDVGEVDVTPYARAIVALRLQPTFLYRVDETAALSILLRSLGYDVAFEQVVGRSPDRLVEVFAISKPEGETKRMVGVVRTPVGAFELFVAHARTEAAGEGEALAVRSVATSVEPTLIELKRGVEHDVARRIVCTLRAGVGNARPAATNVGDLERLIASYREKILFVVPQEASRNAAVSAPFLDARRVGVRGRSVSLIDAMHQFVEGHLEETRFRATVERLTEPSCKTETPTGTGAKTESPVQR